MMCLLRRALLLALMAAFALPALAQERSITVASTTSTEQSGLFGHILPIFTRETGITVRVVALGTGQALDVGRRGDADVVFVHDRAAEERFVADGFGGPRRHVMFNDFVITGPAADPARIAGLGDTVEALRRIATARAPAAAAALPLRQAWQDNPLKRPQPGKKGGADGAAEGSGRGGGRE